MKRWTTQTDTITCSMDLTGAETVIVTYRQKGEEVFALRQDSSELNISKNVITIQKNQEFSSHFAVGPYDFDICAVFPDGSRWNSNRMRDVIESVNYDQEVKENGTV